MAAMIAVGAMGRMWAQGQTLAMSLEQLYKTADEHNTSIKSYESALSEAEAGVRAAKAERLPDIRTDSACTYRTMAITLPCKPLCPSTREELSRAVSTLVA